MIEFFKTCLCCFTYATIKVAQASRCVVYTVKSADNLGCCIPCRAVIELKNCYDHCTAEVGVENNNDVQMAGAAPVDVAMA